LLPKRQPQPQPKTDLPAPQKMPQWEAHCLAAHYWCVADCVFAGYDYPDGDPFQCAQCCDYALEQCKGQPGAWPDIPETLCWFPDPRQAPNN
jgi:hypothetical protein